MRDFFTFGSIDSRDFNAYVFEADTFSGYPMQYDALAVPGKDGDVLTTQNRYPNVQHSYACVIPTDFNVYYPQLRAALLSQIGYARLSDSIHSDEFYLAYFKEDLVPEKWRDFSTGKFALTFTRKPQRYLRTGEQITTLTTAGSIFNPTAFASQPLLRIYGAGSVGVGSDTITISAADTYTDIDCEIMEAYKGTTSKNDKVTLSGNDYPKLMPGANGITLGNGISKVEITPRWATR